MTHPLSALLEMDDVKLVPFSREHIELLRAVYDEDPDIWDIYPVNLSGEYFDQYFAVFRTRIENGEWAGLSIFHDGQLVGLTNYINPNAQMGTVEIGGTFIAPTVRGTGFNRKMKTLMIDHAFACGYRKVGFKVDTRNKRSIAAVLKLGATREGTLRQDIITWTGYIRDTAVFGLMKDEWTG